jgi:hypothetical protein
MPSRSPEAYALYLAWQKACIQPLYDALVTHPLEGRGCVIDLPAYQPGGPEVLVRSSQLSPKPKAAASTAAASSSAATTPEPASRRTKGAKTVVPTSSGSEPRRQPELPSPPAPDVAVKDGGLATIVRTASSKAATSKK